MGIAYYPGGELAAQVIKEPLQSNRSSLAAFLKEYKDLQSRIFISHVRYATSAICYANTHPFSRVLRGREFVFAHNGTLGGEYRESLPVGPWNPLGSTDSEYAFCHLMNTIDNEIHQWNQEGFMLLESTMRRINRFGKFNCLLSDGQLLFAYSDIDGYKRLHYTMREAPFPTVKLKDEDFVVDLAEDKSPIQRGLIITTDPLTDNEYWGKLMPGRLAVIKNGIPIYGLPQEQHICALHVIRSAPHRLSIHQISSKMGITLDEVKPLIQHLCGKGFIRQDSRDTVEPFSPAATYYTVPDKRAEIDELTKSMHITEKR